MTPVLDPIENQVREAHLQCMDSWESDPSGFLVSHYNQYNEMTCDIQNDRSKATIDEALGEIIRFIASNKEAPQAGNQANISTQGKHSHGCLQFYGVFMELDNQGIHRLRMTFDKPEYVHNLTMPSPVSLQWLKEAIQLDEAGDYESAIDIIYDYIDDLLLEGEFIKVNTILKQVDTNILSEDLLVAFLSITLAAKQHLTARSNLFTRVEKTLKERNQYVKELLAGLEN